MLPLDSDMYTLLQHYNSNPLSLLQLSRAVIRTAIGREKLRYIDSKAFSKWPAGIISIIK